MSIEVFLVFAKVQVHVGHTGGFSSKFSPLSGLAARFAKTPSLVGLFAVRVAPVVTDGRKDGSSVILR